MARFLKIIRDLFIVGGVRIWLLYTFILFVVVAPAASIRLTNYAKLKSDLTAVTYTKRQSFVDTSADTLQERIRQIDAYTSGLAAHPQVQDQVIAGKWQEAIDLIAVDRQFHGDPFDDRVFVTDAKGTLQADVPALPNVRGVDYSTRSWFTGVIASGHSYISSAYKRSASPTINIFSVSTPILNSNNQIAGLVVTQVSLNHLRQWIDQLKISDGQVAYIVDQRGQILAGSNYVPQDPITSLATLPAVKRVMSGQSGIFIDGSGQNQRLVAYAPLENYGWGFIVEQPLTQALASQSKTLHQFLSLEWYGSLWNLFILVLLLVTIHRLVQYLFSEDLQHRTARVSRASVPSKKNPTNKSETDTV